MSNFSDLNSEDQVKKVIDICFEIGNLTRTIKASNILNRQNNLAPVVTTEENLELQIHWIYVLHTVCNVFSCEN